MDSRLDAIIGVGLEENDRRLRNSMYDEFASIVDGLVESCKTSEQLAKEIKKTLDDRKRYRPY